MSEPTEVIKRIASFVTNVRESAYVKPDFVIDGVLAIINDDLHLELLDFRPPTEQDERWAREIAEQLGGM